MKAVGEDDFAAFGDAEPAAAGDSAAFAAFGDENPNSDFPAADGFASFAASNDSSSSKGSIGLNGGVGVGPVAGVGGGPADEAAALEVELENARRERDVFNGARRGFLASLTHSRTRVGERLASGDGASVATDDIADEYASFEAGQLEARRSRSAIPSTVWTMSSTACLDLSGRLRAVARRRRHPLHHAGFMWIRSSLTA